MDYRIPWRSTKPSGFIKTVTIQIGTPDFGVVMSCMFSGAVKEAQELTIKSSQRNITIAFAALDYTDATKIKYAYRLKGLEENGIGCNISSNK